MDEAREAALKLAAQCATHDGSPEETVARARAYLDFLCGTRDAEIVSAAQRFGDAMQQVRAPS
jgi:hypothetical protein